MEADFHRSLVPTERPGRTNRIRRTFAYRPRRPPAWLRLTPPSSGRPKGCFAPFGPPLMANYKGFPVLSSDTELG